MSITNIQIEDFARKLKLPIIGVFSKNQLPWKKEVGSYYVNMEDADKGNGTHWVMFKIFKNHKVIYFDSFGFEMPKPVKEWLKPFAPIAINKRQIQDINSQLCGYYCLATDYYMTYDCKTKDIFECYDDYLNTWTINTLDNDRLLKEYLTII